MRRVAVGDPGALAELYDRLAGLLFSNAFHILADRREAEEVVQDVFIQVWNKAATFDRDLGNPLGWILGITRNRCIDRLRSRQRRARLFDESVEQTEVALKTPSPQAAQHLDADELATVHRAVKELPGDHQQAIAMAFFGGMTHQEIADELTVPLGTVKARIRRGMLKLHDSLKAHL